MAGGFSDGQSRLQLKAIVQTNLAAFTRVRNCGGGVLPHLPQDRVRDCSLSEVEARCIAEALIGQLYLTILIAALVGMALQARSVSPDPEKAVPKQD